MKIVAEPHKSSLGLNANLLSVLVFIAMAEVSWMPYVQWVAWALPVVILIMEKESSFVKFHARRALRIGIFLAIIIILFQLIMMTMKPKSDDWLERAMYEYSGKSDELLMVQRVLIVIQALFMLFLAFRALSAYKYKQKVSKKTYNENANQKNNQQEDSDSKKKEQVFCGECGAKNPKGAKVCGSCGEKL